MADSGITGEGEEYMDMSDGQSSPDSEKENQLLPQPLDVGKYNKVLPDFLKENSTDVIRFVMNVENLKEEDHDGAVGEIVKLWDAAKNINKNNQLKVSIVVCSELATRVTGVNNTDSALRAIKCQIRRHRIIPCDEKIASIVNPDDYGNIANHNFTRDDNTIYVVTMRNFMKVCCGLPSSTGIAVRKLYKPVKHVSQKLVEYIAATTQQQLDIKDRQLARDVGSAERQESTTIALFQVSPRQYALYHRTSKNNMEDSTCKLLTDRDHTELALLFLVTGVNHPFAVKDPLLDQHEGPFIRVGKKYQELVNELGEEPDGLRGLPIQTEAQGLNRVRYTRRNAVLDVKEDAKRAAEDVRAFFNQQQGTDDDAVIFTFDRYTDIVRDENEKRNAYLDFCEKHILKGFRKRLIQDDARRLDDTRSENNENNDEVSDADNVISGGGMTSVVSSRSAIEIDEDGMKGATSKVRKEVTRKNSNKKKNTAVKNNDPNRIVMQDWEGTPDKDTVKKLSKGRQSRLGFQKLPRTETEISTEEQQEERNQDHME